MSNKQMTASTSVRIRVNDTKVFGPGIAELLERIDRCESIRTATTEMKIAYSKAWTMLRSAERELGFKLLHSSTGGKGGGGAVLTEEGAQLLARYDELCRRMQAYGRRQFEALFGDE